MPHVTTLVFDKNAKAVQAAKSVFFLIDLPARMLQKISPTRTIGCGVYDSGANPVP
jgi:hypothetical protein